MGNLIQPNINNNPCRPGFHRSGGKCVSNQSPQFIRPGQLLRADATNVEDPQYKGGGKIKK